MWRLRATSSSRKSSGGAKNDAIVKNGRLRTMRKPAIFYLLSKLLCGKLPVPGLIGARSTAAGPVRVIPAINWSVLLHPLPLSCSRTAFTAAQVRRQAPAVLGAAGRCCEVSLFPLQALLPRERAVTAGDADIAAELGFKILVQVG